MMVKKPFPGFGSNFSNQLSGVETDPNLSSRRMETMMMLAALQSAGREVYHPQPPYRVVSVVF